MWSCPRCDEELVDSSDVCWSCGTHRDGTEDPDFDRAHADVRTSAHPCPHCGHPGIELLMGDLYDGSRCEKCGLDGSLDDPVKALRAPKTLECPACEEPMLRGTVRWETHPGGAHGELILSRGDEPDSLLGPWSRRVGYSCPRCSTFVVW